MSLKLALFEQNVLNQEECAPHGYTFVSNIQSHNILSHILLAALGLGNNTRGHYQGVVSQGHLA